MNEYVYNERHYSIWVVSFYIESYLINKSVILKIKWIGHITFKYKNIVEYIKMRWKIRVLKLK